MRRNLFGMTNRINALPTVSALAIAAIGTFGASTPAMAIQFNFGFSDGTPQDVIDGFDAAASAWSSVIKDDVTVNIDVLYQPYAPSSLGQFSPTRVNVAYEDWVDAAAADLTSVDDITAFTNLPKSSDFDLLLNPEFDLLLNRTRNSPNGEGSPVPFADTDGDCNNRSIRLTSANAKALGLPLGGTNNCAPPSFNTASLSDGSILLNSTFAWDFDRTDGISGDAYDFVGIAKQGLGVALGFVSGVDVLDFNSPLESGNRLVFFNDDQFPFVSSVDLFRFSEESRALAESAGLPSLIDWTTGRQDANGQDVDKYFSIDGGATKIASFSTGIRHGDGNRASSWKADDLGGEYIGIMEPTPALGQLLNITETDQRLFDVIGWDLVNPPLQQPGQDMVIDQGGGGSDPDSDSGSNSDDDSAPNPEDPVSVPEPGSAIALFSVMAIAALVRHRRRVTS